MSINHLACVELENDAVDYKLLLAKYMATVVAPMMPTSLSAKEAEAISLIWNRLTETSDTDGKFNWSKFENE